MFVKRYSNFKFKLDETMVVIIVFKHFKKYWNLLITVSQNFIQLPKPIEYYSNKLILIICKVGIQNT